MQRNHHHQYSGKNVHCAHFARTSVGGVFNNSQSSEVEVMLYLKTWKLFKSSSLGGTQVITMTTNFTKVCITHLNRYVGLSRRKCQFSQLFLWPGRKFYCKLTPSEKMHLQCGAFHEWNSC